MRRIAPAKRERVYFASEGLRGMVYRLDCSEGVEGQNERDGAAEWPSHGEGRVSLGWILVDSGVFGQAAEAFSMTVATGRETRT